MLKNDDLNTYLSWGNCRRLQVKIAEAIVEFEQVAKKYPDNKEALVELAILYQQNKEKFVSIEYWEKVYALDEDERAREKLAEFYYSEGNFEKAEKYGKKVDSKLKKEAQEKNSIEEPKEEYVGLIDKIMAFFTKK